MRKVRRVDWEEEAKKDRARRIYGLKYTFLGFIAALMALVGARAMNPQISIQQPLMVIVAMAFGTLLMVVVLSRKDKK